MRVRRIVGSWIFIAALLILFGSAGTAELSVTALEDSGASFSARGLLSNYSVRLSALRAGLSRMGPRTFNPAFAMDPESRLVASLLSTDLLSAAAAIHWNAGETGGSRLTVSLRPGLVWADGSALTANDWVDAVKEIYTDPRIDSVYAKKLTAIGDLQWLALDAATIRIDSLKILTEAEMMSACAIAPQPMAKLREWRKLGQAGSLGTGLRAPADDQFFGFIDSAATDIPSCGLWRVSRYRPGDSLELILREPVKDPVGLTLIQFRFFRDPAAVELAFAAKDLDLLPLLGKPPTGDITSLQTKICAFALSPQVVSLVLNPGIAEKSPWILSLLDKELDRQDWCGRLFGRFAVPESGIWNGKYPLAASIQSKQPIKGQIRLAVQYDRSRPDREMVARLIATRPDNAGLTSRPVPSSVDDMTAWIAFGGNWDAMVVTIDETIDPKAFLNLLGSRIVPVLPLYRPLALIWSQQNLVKLPPDVENLFLAYASALH